MSSYNFDINDPDEVRAYVVERTLGGDLSSRDARLMLDLLEARTDDDMYAENIILKAENQRLKDEAMTFEVIESMIKNGINGMRADNASLDVERANALRRQQEQAQLENLQDVAGIAMEPQTTPEGIPDR